MTFIRISVSPGGVIKKGRWCVASGWIAFVIALLCLARSRPSR
jgi:hypothetical protein